MSCRGRSAYIMFTQKFRKEREERARQNGTRVSPQELMALAASKWKTMDKQEREPFVQESLAERQDVETRFRAWKIANPDVQTGYNKNQKKIVGAPKRSAFFIFLDSLREFEGEGMTEVDLQTQGAACWEGMNAFERMPFLEEAKRERHEYRMNNPSDRALKQNKRNNKLDTKEDRSGVVELANDVNVVTKKEEGGGFFNDIFLDSIKVEDGLFDNHDEDLLGQFFGVLKEEKLF
jgi:hypothetical protein